MSLAKTTNQTHIKLAVAISFNDDEDYSYRFQYDSQTKKLNWNILVSGIEKEMMPFIHYFRRLNKGIDKTTNLDKDIKPLAIIFIEHFEVMHTNTINIPTGKEYLKKEIFPNGGQYFFQSIFCQLFIDNLAIAFAGLAEERGYSIQSQKTVQLYISSFFKDAVEGCHQKYQAEKKAKNDKKRKAKKAKKTAGQTETETETEQRMRELEQRMQQDETRAMEGEDINQAVKHLECEELFAIAHPCYDYDCEVSLDIMEHITVEGIVVRTTTAVEYFL